MLTDLHVKNMALIEEIDLSFEKGLNVITGETGAGKSLLLGSVHLALGGKFSQEMLRNGAQSALVELVFQVEEEAVGRELEELGFAPEEGQMIITRKFQNGRSVCRVNSETCTAAQLRQIAEKLIQIHGQRENQTLLQADKQLRMLDAFGKKEIAAEKEKAAELFAAWQEAGKRLSAFTMNEEERQRELSMLTYEIREIEEAAVAEGEEEMLEAQYRRMKNARKIVEALNQVYAFTGYDAGAGDQIGRALQEINAVADYDETLSGIAQALSDAESILSDINRQASEYLSDFTFSENEFMQTEERLDRIHAIQSKYGNTVEKIQAYAAGAQERLAFLNHYEEEHTRAAKAMEEAETALAAQCAVLSDRRKKCAAGFAAAIRGQLQELNFAQAQIEIAFSRASSYRRTGYDEIELQISANPGEPVRPLSRVASGGELSRIMLAIRNILAEEENTETLIFDEIDAGISGRTAQKVSEKMASIAAGHQVLCVTHLAQIAAMADAHFLIEKTVQEGETRTSVHRLDQDEQVSELARILGGAEITEAVYGNAAEMKELADRFKERS